MILDLGVTFNLFPKQQLMLAHPDIVPKGVEIPKEVLFGGAAGGAKSYGLRAASIIVATECPGVQIYLFRRTYKELDSNHMLGPDGYRAMLAFAIENRLVRIDSQKNIIQFRNGPSGTFNGGSIIYLRHMQYEDDKYDYQGAEIHLLMIDEATHFSESMYSWLRGRTRLGGWKPPEKWKRWFPRIICASNPGSAYHLYWKSMFYDFMDKAHPMRPKRAPTEEGGMLRQYIPATVYDNPALLENDPGYVDRLKGLGSPELVRAMLEGDWDIVAGGMFDDLWNMQTHVLEAFEIPRSWYINRAFDWGSSKPFACLWFAESDGSVATLADGREIAFPAGTLFMVEELYGNDPRAKDPNTGMRITNPEIGMMIRDVENESPILIPLLNSIQPGPADDSIYNLINNESHAMGINSGYWGDSGRSRSDIFFRAGKVPGSRVKRWSLLRDRLASSRDFMLGKEVDTPGIYFFSICYDTIRTIPTMPRCPKNPDDIDTLAEDHIADALGYRCMQTRTGVGRKKVVFG